MSFIPYDNKSLIMCEKWTPDCITECKKWKTLRRGTVRLDHIDSYIWTFNYYRQIGFACKYKNIITSLIYYDKKE